ncbi:MAG: UDP-N-acetylglucosamine 2-epimerase [Pseudomonadota bacterium]
MADRRKVCVVVTARPSYARVRTALEALKARTDVELQVIAAASALSARYGNVADVMAAEGFAPNAVVDSLVEGLGLRDMAETTAKGLSGTAAVLADLKPDVVVTVADRYETLGTAVATAYMNIPLAHLQGGEVTGNVDEKVRHAITKLADLHLVSGPGAAERVRRMGEQPDAIYDTGCPSIDVARQAIEAGARLPDLELYERFGQLGERLDLTDGYVVVMQHPVTTSHGAARAQIEATLQAAQGLALPVLWFAPNVDIGSDATSEAIRDYRAAHNLSHVHFMGNMPPEDFIRLLAGSRGIAGNSSVAIRECAWLGVPAVNIGERQEGRDRGPNVVDVDYDPAAIRAAMEANARRGKLASAGLYGDGRSGPRIAEVLATAPLSFHKRLTY